jgi:Sigma-70, region 4
MRPPVRNLAVLDGYDRHEAVVVGVLTILPCTSYSRITIRGSCDRCTTSASARWQDDVVAAASIKGHQRFATWIHHSEAAIATLPVPFRETLVLREVQGLSYRAIAEVSGVSIGTVQCPAAPPIRRARRPQPGSNITRYSRSGRTHLNTRVMGSDQRCVKYYCISVHAGMI